MINVPMPAIPLDFEEKVRGPGLLFLAENPAPKGDEWKAHRYWKESHQALYDSLGGICSYCATYTPRRPGASGLDHTSVDHFVPKSKNVALAYEWSNYRLCRTRLNNRKADYTDIVDPYIVANGRFTLDFTSFHIAPAPELSEDERGEVLKSVARLKLNDDDAYVNERARVVYSYSDGKILINQIQKYYPFIASEMVAQDFDNNHLPRFKKALASKFLRAALVAQGVI
ncbi:HNH endonuclease [Burkholderia seminalis]|uniref:HNH endonuclease n=1 Tax=Burkholderia seminalis TaxID=488731 RepID=UPI0026563630|nr:hypothetical protein [Burkholderia seminalis]MDN7587265.1 hypothetical protein [Burkholderia seminalis]